MNNELYVIVKKFNDGHEDANFCTFDLNTALMMWSDVIEECDCYIMILNFANITLDILKQLKM